LHGCALAQSAVTFESEGYIDPKHHIWNDWAPCEDLSGSKIRSSEYEYGVLELIKIRVESPDGEMNVLLYVMDL
jgi:hypothetical protein